MLPIVKTKDYSNNMNLMIALLVFCVALPMVQSSAQIISSGCIQYAGGLCLRCSLQTHLGKNGLCYQNIIGCREYGGQGQLCQQCDVSISRKVGNTCQLLENQGPLSYQLKKSIYRYGNPGDQYGENSFIPVTFQEIKNQQTFKLVDRRVRTREYGHFISRSKNPVYSVHYYVNQKQSTYSYKMLYQGSGGGIFLLIADVPASVNANSPTSKVIIRSLVVISLTQVIDYCIDYDTGTLSCTLCQNGYHLEGGVCYKNTGACLRYKKNICIECLDYFLLVQNRCISDCTSIADGRSILYYSDFNYQNQTKRVSTLQRYTQISITIFYAVQKITTAYSTKTTNTNYQEGEGSGWTHLYRDTNYYSGNNSSSSTTTSTTTYQTSFSLPYASTSNIKTLELPSTSHVIMSNSTNQSLVSIKEDPNCALVNTKTGECERCAYFYFKNKDKVCQQVDPFCKGFSQQNGDCTSCYTGYQLKDTKCKIKRY